MMWIFSLLRYLPKISLFYLLLTAIGFATYSVFLLVPAIILDLVDYSSFLG